MGKGKSGLSGGEMSTPEQRQTLARSNAESVVSNMRITSYYQSSSDPNNEKLKAAIVKPNWKGSVEIASLNTSKSKPTKADFEKVTGVSQDNLISALKELHPNSDVEIKYKHFTRDKYSRGGARPAHTRWELTIK